MKYGNYFPHWSNARNDRKVINLMREMGAAGYAYYFMILEILREQPDFRHPLEDLPAIAWELRIEREVIHRVIHDFDLFIIDDTRKVFFSLRLIEALQPALAASQRAIEANRVRWQKHNAAQGDDPNGAANGDPNGDANGDPKKQTIKQTKKTTLKTPAADHNKIDFKDFVRLSDEEMDSLVDKYGKPATDAMIEMLDNYKGSSGKTYKSDYRAILSWVVREYKKLTPPPQVSHLGHIKKQTPEEDLEAEKFRREYKEMREKSAAKAQAERDAKRSTPEADGTKTAGAVLKNSFNHLKQPAHA